MSKGLEDNNTYRREYTSLQKQVIKQLAEIEQEDADRCATCGGEDCCCCEYWQDRQRWVEPSHLFNYDPYDDYDPCDEW